MSAEDEMPFANEIQERIKEMQNEMQNSKMTFSNPYEASQQEHWEATVVFKQNPKKDHKEMQKGMQNFKMSLRGRDVPRWP